MPEVSGVIRCFRPFPWQLTCAPAAEMDIGAAKADQFGRPQAGLGGKTEQCVVAPPGPGRPIGRGEQGVDFRLGQEGHEPSVEALWRNGKNTLDQSGMLWMPKRRVSEQRADRGKPSIAGAHAIFPLMLQVVEEGADQRGIEIVDIQLAWRLAFLSEAKTSSSRRVSRYAASVFGLAWR